MSNSMLLPIIFHSLTIFFCIFGLILFSWWWWKIKKATAIYVIIMFLFFAEVVEKSSVLFIRLFAIESGNHILFYNLINNWWWKYISLPTTITYTLVVFLMTYRIIKTKKAIEIFKERVNPKKIDKHCVLLVTENEKTSSELAGIFITNGIPFLEVSNYDESLDFVLEEENIIIVFFDSNSFNKSKSLQSKFISIVKDQKPWLLFIAVTRKPTREDFIQKKIMGFDDYIHLPINPIVLVSSYNRWKARINRWENIGKRRKTNGRKK
jgi:hypothetical protein